MKDYNKYLVAVVNKNGTVFIAWYHSFKLKETRVSTNLEWHSTTAPIGYEYKNIGNAIVCYKPIDLTMSDLMQYWIVDVHEGEYGQFVEE